SGSISLDIPGVEKDSCLLIISGQHGEPFIRTLYFAESDTAWMNINDVDISDATGNDNGLADYSETIALKVSMQNAGNEDADNAYLIISSGSGYLEIINDSLFIGNIAANTEAMATGFEILIADSIPDLKIATINIELHHNGNILSYDTDISLHAPELMIINCMTDDSETGNGNGLPEADERVKLIFRVTNNGSSSCSGSLLISNISGYISFDATLLPVGQVKPGEVTEISVFADIDVNTPESTEIAFDTELQCLPYIARKTLSIIAGRLTEDFELLNFTTFPWINNTAKPWIITDEASRSNTYSARSGHISHNEKSELAMLLNLPEDDTLRFWYRVSSETSWDSLVFMSGDHVLLSESGEINWTQALIPLNKGVHLLKWIYAKDQSVSLGSDCAYIDLIRFPALSFVQSAISLNRIISPIKGENHSDEVLSLELSNLGRDTVDIISLTYIVNESSPVNESFSTDLKPGDTITLSFAETIDMSVENIYDISVYVSEPDNYFINDTLKITIISTDIENPDLSGKAFTISPNPVRDNIRIICHRNSQDNLLSLYNSSGMIIYREEIDQLSPGQQLFLYPGQLAKGSYILVIRNNQKKYFFKILKL
ncbi:MAG: T9SS type A sorting domain-containing protein, partial [Bacteroidales bacterium]|nr:T9SS type A sorting domain-containing protein [Bacteroidales bacterium]